MRKLSYSICIGLLMAICYLPIIRAISRVVEIGDFTQWLIALPVSLPIFVYRFLPEKLAFYFWESQILYWLLIVGINFTLYSAICYGGLSISQMISKYGIHSRQIKFN